MIEAACGDQAGTADLFGVGTGASLIRGWAGNPDSLKTTVKVARLDEIVPPASVTAKTVFLVDVEGFELEVLKGADGILGLKEKPVWILESGLTDHRQGSDLNQDFLEVFRILDAAGFDMYAITNPDRPVGLAIIEQSLAQKKDLIGCYNFLVVPSGQVPEIPGL